MNTLIQIAELANFKCLMGDCPDTCCKGWEIPVDTKTFNLWQNDADSKSYLEKLRVVSTHSEPSACVAKILLEDNNRCSFLNKDGLCAIHLKKGEDLLSHTCRSYPREINRFWGMYERSFTLSCPEVARLTLSPSEPLNLSYIEEDAEYWICREIQEPSNLDPNLIPKLYEVRALSILRAQDRSSDIFTRIALFNELTETAQISNEELSTLESTSLETYLNQIKTEVSTHQTKKREVTKDASSLIKILSKYIKKDDPLNYLLNATSEDRSLTRRQEIILEHVFVTLLYRSLFPFSSNNKETINEISNILFILIFFFQKNHLLLKSDFYDDIEILITQKTMKLIDHFEDLRLQIRST
jgi:lysine-N-methylase